MRTKLILGLTSSFVLSSGALAQDDFSSVEIETIEVADGLYMLVGQGGNIGLSPGAWPDPSSGAETDTIIIPGHGHIYDANDLIQYRDMVVTVRDRVAHFIEQGMSLEQVKAADPTLGWNTLYGSDTPPFTTARFVDSVYAELSDTR